MHRWPPILTLTAQNVALLSSSVPLQNVVVRPLKLLQYSIQSTLRSHYKIIPNLKHDCSKNRQTAQLSTFSYNTKPIDAKQTAFAICRSSQNSNVNSELIESILNLQVKRGLIPTKLWLIQLLFSTKLRLLQQTWPSFLKN